MVLFGATGDLAYKKIFPSLQRMVQRGTLSVPVIGVAGPGWTIEQLRDRVKASLAEHDGGIDDTAFAKLTRPTFYLAIPPVLFHTAVTQLNASGCLAGGRVVLEKPFGRNLATARSLNETLRGVLPESAVFRIDHYRPRGRHRGIMESR